MNSILDAQKDMRDAYYDGAPGVFISGTVWVTAGAIALVKDANSAILALLIGGMLIFPASVLLCKVLGITGKHQKDNPLSSLAMENTFWMLLSIPIAVAASLHQVEWFFPAMMLIIGGRYLTFSTLYGMRIYWLLAVALVAASMALIIFSAATFIGALTGGAIELIFALAIVVFRRKHAD